MLGITSQCIGQGMTEAEYVKLPGYRLSQFVATVDTADPTASLYEALFAPPSETPAMVFGRLVHCMALEPNEVDKRYVCIPQNMRITAKVRDQYPDHTIVKADQYYAAERVAHIARHALQRDYDLETADFETGYVLEIPEPAHPLDVITLKTRIDMITPDATIDLKTTTDVDFRRLCYTIRNYGYDISAVLQAIAAGKKQAVLLFVSKDTFPRAAYVTIDVGEYQNHILDSVETFSQAIRSMPADADEAWAIYRPTIRDYALQSTFTPEGKL